MADLKVAMRRMAYAARAKQKKKDRLSRKICGLFTGSEEYLHAETVMWYVHCRSEVRTLAALTEALAGCKRITIPYCTRDRLGNAVLGLWHLHDLSELRPGTWGILEPPRERWKERARKVEPEALDLVMVPGVAFDRQGGRLGHGAGYYDRLLKTVRTDTVLTAVCFHSQLFQEVPMEKHDIYMDYVMTESQCYKGIGRNCIACRERY